MDRRAARGGKGWRALAFACPFRGKNEIISGTPVSGRFQKALFLVELSRGVKRAGERLMLSTCTHTILLGSESPTFNAYPCQIFSAQCREIVDTANVLDGSVGAVASARRSGQEDCQRGTPPVSLASCSISPFLRAFIFTE